MFNDVLFLLQVQAWDTVVISWIIIYFLLKTFRVFLIFILYTFTVYFVKRLMNVY